MSSSSFRTSSPEQCIKRRSQLSEAERRLNREKNKLAARKCRERKKLERADAEHSREYLQWECLSLKSRLDQLIIEVHQLRHSVHVLEQQNIARQFAGFSFGQSGYPIAMGTYPEDSMDPTQMQPSSPLGQYQIGELSPFSQSVAMDLSNRPIYHNPFAQNSQPTPPDSLGEVFIESVSETPSPDGQARSSTSAQPRHSPPDSSNEMLIEPVSGKSSLDGGTRLSTFAQPQLSPPESSNEISIEPVSGKSSLDGGVRLSTFAECRPSPPYPSNEMFIEPQSRIPSQDSGVGLSFDEDVKSMDSLLMKWEQ